MDINYALGLWRGGKLRNLDLHGLKTMSAECVVFIQNHIPEAALLQAAIDDEIRRKEAKESSDKLLQQTQNLTGQINNLQASKLYFYPIIESVEIHDDAV